MLHSNNVFYNIYFIAPIDFCLQGTHSSFTDSKMLNIDHIMEYDK